MTTLLTVVAATVFSEWEAKPVMSDSLRIGNITLLIINLKRLDVLAMSLIIHINKTLARLNTVTS